MDNPTNRLLPSAELAQLLLGHSGYIAGLNVIDRAVRKKVDRLKSEFVRVVKDAHTKVKA